MSSRRFELPLGWGDAEWVAALRRSHGGAGGADPQATFARLVVRRCFALCDAWRTHDALAGLLLKADEGVYAPLVPPRANPEAAASMLLPPPPPPPAAAAAAAPAAASAAVAAPLGAGAGAGAEAGAMAEDAVSASSASSSSSLATAASSSPAPAPAPSPLSSALRAFAAASLERLRRKPAVADADMRSFLRSSAAERDAPPPAALLAAFSHALLLHARANVRNAYVLLRRYRGALDGFGAAGAGEGAGAGAAAEAEDEAEAGGPPLPPLSPRARADVLLSSVWRVWARSPHVALMVSEALIDVGLAEPADAVQFAIGGAAPEAAAALGAAPETRTNGVLVGDDEGEGEGAGEDEAVLDDAGAATAGAAAAAGAGAAGPLLALARRVGDARTWELAHCALDRSAAAAHSAAVRVSLALGGGVDDPKDAEAAAGGGGGFGGAASPLGSAPAALAAAAAAAREEAFVAAARAAARRHLDALVAALAAGVAAARALVRPQLAAGEGAGGAAPDEAAALARAELARVALAHVRDACRRHGALFAASSAARARLAAAAASPAQSGDDRGGAPSALLLAAASGAFAGVAQAEVAPALQRDREAVVPWRSVAQLLDEEDEEEES